LAGINKKSRPKKHVARISPGWLKFQPSTTKSQLPFDQSSDSLDVILAKLTASENERSDDDLAAD